MTPKTHTNDPSTWTQGKLLQEVYKLKSLNDELVELLKESITQLQNHDLQYRIQQALKKASE